MRSAHRPQARAALLLLLGAILCQAPVAAQEKAAPTYWQDIRPVFRKHCTVCHSGKNVRELEVSGGLALDTHEAVLKGTANLVVRKGMSADSRLVKLLEIADPRRRMPLDAPPLAQEHITLIRRWIDTGAAEGKTPDDGPEVAALPKSPVGRKLDITLATNLLPPAGMFGPGASAKLMLHLKAGPLPPAVAVAFSPDGSLLATGGYGQVTVWDLQKVQPVKVLTNVLGAVNDVRFSPDGKLLAVAGGQPSAKGDLRLYQVSDWKLLSVLRGHEDVIFSIAFRPDGQQLASASFDKSVRIWDVTKLATVKTLTDHSDFVYAVAFSPDGKKIASASKDRTVRLVEIATGKTVFTLGGMEQDVMAVAYSPDGKSVISSGFETGLHWWSTQTGEKVRVQAGHGVAVHELCFSKDGSQLYSAGADRTVRVWNGSTGVAIKTIPAGSLTYAVAVSSSRKQLATGSYDGLVRLWDIESGRLLLTLLALPLTGEQADWLALTPEGYALASAGVTAQGKWRMGGREVSGEKLWPQLQQHAVMQRAAAGQAVTAVGLQK